jgi:hypothetical protein
MLAVLRRLRNDGVILNKLGSVAPYYYALACIGVLRRGSKVPWLLELGYWGALAVSEEGGREDFVVK